MAMRFALWGAGFWAGYQLAAWREVRDENGQPLARCVAICDPDLARAASLADRFGVGLVAARPDDTLENIDFVDIVTPPSTHPVLVRKALAAKRPTLCQKPLAESVGDALALVELAKSTNVPLIAHENWRFQTPIRALKAALETGAIGDVFRARLTFVSSFDVFANQPFLKTLERFILNDIGVHILDCARFLFGDAQSVYATTAKVRRDIAGEDTATVLSRHGRITVVTEIGYPGGAYERHRFPQTFAFIEGSTGTIELADDFSLRITTESGTHSRRVAPPRYDWADPEYDVVQSSMVPCLADALRGLRGETCESAASENIKTLRLVEAAYESAETGRAVTL